MDCNKLPQAFQPNCQYATKVIGQPLRATVEAGQKIGKAIKEGEAIKEGVEATGKFVGFPARATLGVYQQIDGAIKREINSPDVATGKVDVKS